MKKGKKMPAIEIEGTSSARYELRDGKIVRVEADNESLRPNANNAPSGPNLHGERAR